MFFGSKIINKSIGSCHSQAASEIQRMQKVTANMLSLQMQDLQRTASKASSMQAQSQELIKSLDKLAQAAKSKLG